MGSIPAKGQCFLSSINGSLVEAVNVVGIRLFRGGRGELLSLSDSELCSRHG